MTFPVVDFQESPRLLSSLQSFISFQTDCKYRWNFAAGSFWGSRAGADRGLETEYARRRALMSDRRTLPDPGSRAIPV